MWSWLPCTCLQRWVAGATLLCESSATTALDTAECLRLQIIGYAAYGAALTDGGSFLPFFQVLGYSACL